MQDFDFAALVKILRTARGLTQEDFARELDVTLGTMSGWENGKHRPVKAQRNRLLGLASDMRIQVPRKAEADESRNGHSEPIGGQ